MRFLRLLSARGQPERLKDKRGGKPEGSRAGEEEGPPRSTRPGSPRGDEPAVGGIVPGDVAAAVTAWGGTAGQRKRASEESEACPSLLGHHLGRCLGHRRQHLPQASAHSLSLGWQLPENLTQREREPRQNSAHMWVLVNTQEVPFRRAWPSLRTRASQSPSWPCWGAATEQGAQDQKRSRHRQHRRGLALL